MKKNSFIFLAGHNGLVGKSVLNLLKNKGFRNIITVDKKKLDLRNFDKVKKFFKKKKIDYMVMAAARAGGIIANSSNQKDFYLENVEIQNSLLKLALEKKNKKDNLSWNFLYIPKICKNPNYRGQFTYRRIRKNKSMLCNSKNFRN